MPITRRSFLRYCGLSAAALGLDAAKLRLLNEDLANPAAPSIIWLIGSACTGCSVSFLNRISDVAPVDVADVVANAVNLVFHPTIMGAAGETAVAALKAAYAKGNYILVLEGAVPTAFQGHPCVVWSYKGEEVTYQQAVQELTARATATVCVGTCACFGGIPASGANPTRAMGVRAFTGRPTINISGCPANPDWVVWAIVQLLTNTPVALDEDGRPLALYSKSFTGEDEPPIIHDKCPRNPFHTGTPEAANFGENGHCLVNLGCRGPFTKSRCNAAWCGIGGHTAGQPHPGHWCIGVNAPCHGCVEKTFPGPQSFYEPYAP
jgi:NiFe hydrogenase small subunit HydA